MATKANSVHTLTLGVASVLFLVGSAVLFQQATTLLFGDAQKAFAVAKPYTTKWQATQVLQVTAGTYNSGTKTYNFNASPFKASIGVAEWVVKGSVPSTGVKFKETWSIPGGQSMQATIGQGNCGGHDCWNDTGSYSVVIDNANKKDYLMGFAESNDTGDHLGVRIQSVPAPTSGTYTGAASGQTYGNGAVYCSYQSDYLCAIATGNYAFSFVYKPGDFNFNPNRMTYFEPMTWTINGVVCDKANDPECL